MEKLEEQVHLRTQGRLAGISAVDLPDCDNNIDCFGSGRCVNNYLFLETCFC